ncbi:hypothetical protein KC980_00135 [candidate division WWE3 bacterium]|uniref:Glycosyltransferase 2-like domain-containing protein n=1 Tax=candidate division WWE3 bacterium TaxID=2053526 RepID=A0A955EAP4_UNCKA|nr:hypothetical protein [candidate division WWE3 bacterium]
MKDAKIKVNLIVHPAYTMFLDSFLNHIEVALRHANRENCPISILLSYCQNPKKSKEFRDIVSNHNNLNITTYIESERMTCGGARNYLFSKEPAEWNIFTDVDILFHKNYFVEVLNCIKKLETENRTDVMGLAGGIGCWGDTKWGYYEYLNEMKAYYGKADTCKEMTQYKEFAIIFPNTNIGILENLQKNKYIKYFQGYNQILHKKVLTNLGGFDSKFFGAEDREVAARILHHKGKIIFIPQALVYHYFRFTLRDILRRKYGHGYYSAKFRNTYSKMGLYETGFRKWRKILSTLIVIPLDYRTLLGVIYYIPSTMCYFIGSLTFNIEKKTKLNLFGIHDINKAKKKLIKFNYSNFSYVRD